MPSPKLSFGAKTLLLELTDAHLMSRRRFLQKATILVGGALLFSVALTDSRRGRAEAADCSCHSACYTNCHSDCGRKTW